MIRKIMAFSKKPLKSIFQSLKSFRHNIQSGTLYIGIVIFILVFILFPILNIIFAPSWEDWINVFTTSRYIEVVRNTFIMGIVSTLSASFFGFIFAFAIERAKIWGRKFFSTVALLPIIAPPFLAAMSIIMLLGRRGIITSFFGLNIDIYGLTGIWIAQTIAAFPLAFLMMRVVFQNMNFNLEYAAQDLGASKFDIFVDIILPILKPGLIGAMLLVSIQVLADFATPLIVGGRFGVLATEAYMRVEGWGQLGMGAALAILLFVPTGGLFIAQKYFLKQGHFVTVSGKGQDLEAIFVPKPVKILLFFICSFMSLAVLAIYGVVVVGALVRVWGVDFSLALDNIWQAIGRSDVLWNSISYAAISALLVASIAILTVYLIHRKKFFGQQFMDFSMLIPAALPGTMVGLAYLIAFNTPPLRLTGTATIIIAAMVIRSLPMGYRTAVSNFSQIGSSLDESAADLGAGTLKRFFTVIAPLMVPSFSSALVYTFMRSVNTLSAVIFLVVPGTRLASVTIVELIEYGEWGAASALSLILIGTVFITLGVFKLILGDRFSLFT